MAKAALKNYSDLYVFMLLIDERPEEVTDMEREVKGPNCEVISSTFDEPASRHIQVAEMVMEKAKRMVEYGYDVLIFLDSIAPLAQAWNTECPSSGKLLSGGLDANALSRPNGSSAPPARSRKAAYSPARIGPHRRGKAPSPSASSRWCRTRKIPPLRRSRRPASAARGNLDHRPDQVLQLHSRLLNELICYSARSGSARIPNSFLSRVSGIIISGNTLISAFGIRSPLQ